MFPFSNDNWYDTVALLWNIYVGDFTTAQLVEEKEHFLSRLCYVSTKSDLNLNLPIDELVEEHSSIAPDRVSSNFVFVVDADASVDASSLTLSREILQCDDTATIGGDDVQCYQDLLRLWGNHPNRPGPLHADIVSRAFEDVKLETTGVDTVLTNMQTFVFDIQSKPVAQTMDIDKPTALLLHGPPGTGKTTTIRRLLTSAGVFVVYVGSAAELKRPYIGETEKIIKFLFDQCKLHSEQLCAIFLDEIDNITESRNGDSGSHKQDWISLLLRIIGSEDYPNLLLIGSTNRKSKMDEAILRPGRMDEQYFFPTLGGHARWELFKDAMKDFSALSWSLKKDRYLFRMATTNFSGSGVRKIASQLSTSVLMDGLKEDLQRAPLREVLKILLDRDERALFDGGDMAELIKWIDSESFDYRNPAELSSRDIPPSGVILIWEKGREIAFQSWGNQMRLVDLSVFGRSVTQTRVFCAILALYKGYVHVLDGGAVKDNKVDEKAVERVFDEAREMSCLEGSIVFVNVDDLVGIQEVVDTTFYEWRQNGKEMDKFERVAVQRLQATHVGQQTSDCAKRHYRHHGEIAELSAAEDKVESLAPGIGKREETVDISMSFKRPEVIHLLLSKLQDFAGWTEGRKCGFVLKCENKVLRAHFKEYIGVVEEDQIVEEAVDEDDVSAAETEPSLERDGKVLLKLAKCFGKNADWLRQGAGDEVGKWRGIRILDFKDELGGVRVCEINWSKESLHGDLGAAEKLWSKLNGLYYFDLSDNGLTGSILLGGLEYCQGLDLSRNNLSGDISCLDKLKRLKLERLKLVNGSKDRPDENFKEVSSVLCRLEFCCRTNRSALLFVSRVR